MIIEILDVSFIKGEKSIRLEKPRLLTLLNMIIEWEHCKFPMTSVEKVKEGEEPEEPVENKKFLGEDPELRVGDVFIFEGQVIGIIDKNTLTLLTSETGMGALERVWKETIEPELDAKFKFIESTDIDWKVVSNTTGVPNVGLVNFIPPYEYYELWRTRFAKGRLDLEKEAVKIKMTSENLIMPLDMYFLNRSVKFDSKYIDEEQIDSITKEAVAWFIGLHERAFVPEFPKRD